MHPLAIQRLIHQGKLPAQMIANRWVIPRQALAKFAEGYVPKRGRPRKKRKYTKRSPIWNRP